MGELLAKTWLFLADSGKIPRSIVSLRLLRLNACVLNSIHSAETLDS